jgi:DNA replication protein DnaC
MFSDCADGFDDAVIAAALLDRLLHHDVVIAIEGNSCRPRGHADLALDINAADRCRR